MPGLITVDWPQDKLDEWIKLANGRTQDFVSTFLQELNNEVVLATPVRTGFLRASWWVGIGNVPDGAPGGSGGGGGADVMNVVAATVKVLPGLYFHEDGKRATRLLPSPKRRHPRNAE